MEAKETVAGVDLRPAMAGPIPEAAVWSSLTQSQRERVRQIVVQVCRERLREERSDEPV